MLTCRIFNSDTGLWRFIKQGSFAVEVADIIHTVLSAVVIRLSGYMYAREAFRELGRDMFCPTGVATHQKPFQWLDFSFILSPIIFGKYVEPPGDRPRSSFNILQRF